jgi:hypothetical protein
MELAVGDRPLLFYCVYPRSSNPENGVTGPHQSLSTAADHIFRRSPLKPSILDLFRLGVCHNKEEAFAANSHGG